MATGAVDNWLNVDTFGAIYPFIGTEHILAIVGIIFWLGWHILQIRKESKEFQADIDNIRQKGGVDKVLEEEISREMDDILGR